MKRLLANFTSLLILVAGTQHSNGAVNIVLSGTPGSSIISYALSGTGTFTSTASQSSFTASALSFDAFTGFQGSFAISGSGTLTNTTTSQAFRLTNILVQVQEIDGGGDGEIELVQFTYEAPVASTSGDSYSISGSGTFNISSAGATLDNMNAGSGAFAVTDPIDAVNLTIIPEPSRALLSLLGLGAVLVWRRRD